MSQRLWSMIRYSRILYSSLMLWASWVGVTSYCNLWDYPYYYWINLSFLVHEQLSLNMWKFISLLWERLLLLLNNYFFLFIDWKGSWQAHVWCVFEYDYGRFHVLLLFHEGSNLSPNACTHHDTMAIVSVTLWIYN